jgi:hypothetical protein
MRRVKQTFVLTWYYEGPKSTEKGKMHIWAWTAEEARKLASKEWKKQLKHRPSAQNPKLTKLVPVRWQPSA